MSNRLPGPYWLWSRRALVFTGVLFLAAIGFAFLGMAQGFSSNHQASHTLFWLAGGAAVLAVLSLLATLALTYLNWRQDRKMPWRLVVAGGIALVVVLGLWLFLGMPGWHPPPMD